MSKKLKLIKTLITSLKVNSPYLEEEVPSPSKRVPGLWNSRREANGYEQFDLYIQEGIADRAGENIEKFISQLFELCQLNFALKLNLRIFKFGKDQDNPEAYKTTITGRRYSKSLVTPMLKWLGSADPQTAILTSFAANTRASVRRFVIVESPESIVIDQAFQKKVSKTYFVYCNPELGWELGKDWCARYNLEKTPGPAKRSLSVVKLKEEDAVNFKDISITLQTNIMPCFGKSTEQKFELVAPGEIIVSKGSANNFLQLVRPDQTDDSVIRHKLTEAQYRRILDLAVGCLDVQEADLVQRIEMQGTSTSLSIEFGSETRTWQSRLFKKLGNARLDKLIDAMLLIEKK